MGIRFPSLLTRTKAEIKKKKLCFLQRPPVSTCTGGTLPVTTPKSDTKTPVSCGGFMGVLITTGGLGGKCGGGLWQKRGCAGAGGCAGLVPETGGAREDLSCGRTHFEKKNKKHGFWEILIS